MIQLPVWFWFALIPAFVIGYLAYKREGWSEKVNEIENTVKARCESNPTKSAEQLIPEFDDLKKKDQEQVNKICKKAQQKMRDDKEYEKQKEKGNIKEITAGGSDWITDDKKTSICSPCKYKAIKKRYPCRNGPLTCCALDYNNKRMDEYNCRTTARGEQILNDAKNFSEYAKAQPSFPGAGNCKYYPRVIGKANQWICPVIDGTQTKHTGFDNDGPKWDLRLYQCTPDSSCIKKLEDYAKTLPSPANA